MTDGVVGRWPMFTGPCEMTAERSASMRRLLATFAGLAVVTAAVVVLADLAPEPVPHLPFWLLVSLFVLAGVDGYLGGDDWRGLSPPASRVAVIVGLVFDLPLHLLGAQALGMALVAGLPDGRTSQDKVLDLAGSVAATGNGILVFVAMSEPALASGRDVWFDAGVAGLAVVAASHVIDAVRSRSETPVSPTSRTDRARTIGRDLTAVAIGLVIVEVLRADVAGGWLLALPMVAVLLTRRRSADTSARAALLLELGDAEVRLRASLKTQDAVEIAAEQLAAMTRATQVRVSVTLPAAPTVTAEVSSGAMPRRRWGLARAHPDGTDTRPERWYRLVADRDHERTVVPVIDGELPLGTVEVLDRLGSSRIRRVHGEAIRLLANALGQQVQLIQRMEEMRALSAQDRLLANRLQSSNEELEQIDATRSVFLATTSHELRAPLSALLAEAQVLEHIMRSGTWDADVRRLIDGVGENARHLLRMVDDLLALVRLEADRLEVVRLPLDLVEVVITVADTFRPMLEASGIDLVLATPLHAPIVGDRDRVWQVLANLVDNAGRVMPHGGAIDIRIRRDADTLLLSVHDTGPGIAADELARMFMPFERGAVRGPGLGLGLAIARALMERHGGHLVADSRIGVGTTFTAVFPATARVGEDLSAPAAHSQRAFADTAPGPVASQDTWRWRRA